MRHVAAFLLALVGVCAASVAHGAADRAPLPPYLLTALPDIGATALENDKGLSAQALAMVGREDRVASTAQAGRTCVIAADDPVAAIAARAADAPIVIINEAYDSPRDRAFIGDVARALAPLGFKTYAAEAFFNDGDAAPEAQTQRGDGVYTGEPVFGAMLRDLRGLGYRFVSYEDVRAPARGRHFTDALNARESGGASNLINRTLRNAPSHKVLVHVGYGHNQETVQRVDGHDVRMMALQIREITGIDPLTVDQTSFGADRDGVCLSENDGAALPASRDIYIAHAIPAFQRNRPTWRIARGQRFADVPRALRRDDARVIVEARPAADPADAVPADRIMIDPGETIPLLLEPGRYKTRAWIDDAWTSDVALTVREITAQPVVAHQKARQKTSRRKTR